MSLLCLQVARSKLIKDWVDAEDEVTYCYNEAKDNAKFIQALEKCCHCLYLDDPVSQVSPKNVKVSVQFENNDSVARTKQFHERVCDSGPFFNLPTP